MSQRFVVFRAALCLARLLLMLQAIISRSCKPIAFLYVALNVTLVTSINHTVTARLCNDSVPPVLEIGAVAASVLNPVLPADVGPVTVLCRKGKPRGSQESQVLLREVSCYGSVRWMLLLEDRFHSLEKCMRRK